MGIGVLRGGVGEKGWVSAVFSRLKIDSCIIPREKEAKRNKQQREQAGNQESKEKQQGTRPSRLRRKAATRVYLIV
jgi:hypothetical protein